MAAAILFLQVVHARLAALANAAPLRFNGAELTLDGVPLRFSPL